MVHQFFKLSFLSLLLFFLFGNCGGSKKQSNDANLLALLGNTNSIRNSSNSPESSVNLKSAEMGPNLPVITQAELDSSNPTELVNNISSSVSYNQVNVEVNIPITFTLNNGYNPLNTDATNSYFVDYQNGKILFSRVVVNGNTVTMIPQIKLQPTRTYVVVLGGVVDSNNISYGDYRIKYSNKDLDYGLYWYGKNGVCEKYYPGVANSFYDNSKKAVIFAHGWQVDTTITTDPFGRPNFDFTMYYFFEDNFNDAPSYNGLAKWTNHSWVDDGWNTGIVYWAQFADEPVLGGGNFAGLYAAEAKVWNLVDGPNGSRYRTLDTSGNDIYKNWDRNVNFNGQTITVGSVGELLSLYVVDALNSNTSGNIRLTGHSLGNQVITHIAYYVDQANIGIKRIALLDPAWTDGAKSWLPVVDYAATQVKLNHNGVYALDGGSLGTHYWPAEISRVILYEIMNHNWNDGIVVERYNSTILNLYLPIVDENRKLSKQISVTDLKPWFYGTAQLPQKHTLPRHNYFWSYEANPPVECTVTFGIRNPTGNVAASAATGEVRMRELMLNGKYHSQVEGRYTVEPNDDWFETKNQL
ncbi:MAG: Ig-like domain-containing protein [Leptospiraceae bacterium]|nr:Ig-like domain-containing protein [Leptospiraceae bacterium]